MGKKVLTIIMMFIFTFILMPNNLVFAEDDGYYYKSMNINVEVLDNRKYIITETLNVHFNEERHGIIREIPKYSKNDKYTIEDVSVDGDIYEINDYSDLEIKIGNPDKKIKGYKKYVIKYTINNYADSATDGDYLYLNILGTDFDTKIESFKATVNFFEAAEILNYKLTSGEYGSTTNENFTVNLSGNKLLVQSKSTVNPYNGATLNVKLEEGAFKNAKFYIPDCTINSDKIDIKITEEKEYLVSRNLKITKNNENNASVELWSGYGTDNSTIYDIYNSNDKFNVSTSYIHFPSTPGEYTVNITFKVKPTLRSKIEFEFGSVIRDYNQENIEIKVTSPFDINSHSIQFSNNEDNEDNSKYYANITKGREFEFKTLDNKITKGKITVALDIDNSLFKRETHKSTYIMTIISLILMVLALLLYLIFGREKRLNKSVEFYPPEGLNSAELGYIIDENISGSDITSLIFYWASKGYIKVESLEHDKVKLYKLKELRKEEFKTYEIELFNRIFSYGKNNVVTNIALKGKLYRDINLARTRIKSLYKGERSLNNKNVTLLSICVLILSFIPAIFLGAMSLQSTNDDMIVGAVLALLFISPVLTVIYVLFRILCKTDYKSKVSSGKITTVIFSALIFGVLYFLFTLISELDNIWLISNLACSFVIFVTAIFIRKRTKYGRELLEKVLGFKKFLEEANKDKIEELVDTDAEYFYNILPYAQVLGVTKLWTKKFTGIKMNQPTWYYHYNHHLGYLFADSFIEDMNKISRDSTYSPSSSGGSSSSGGGYSGGGFSGGGSGGGGGSSW